MLVANGYDPDPRVHKEATDLLRMGYSVSVLSWDRELRRTAVEAVDGIQIRRFRYLDPHGFLSYAVSGVLFLLTCLFSLLRDALGGKKTIVQCNDFNTLPVGYLLRLCLKSRVRLVYDSHENFSALLQTIAPRLVASSVRAIERKMLNSADGLIAANDEILLELHPPEKIVSAPIFNAPPLSITQFTKGHRSPEIYALRRKFGKDCFVLTFPGRFQIHRGLKEMLDAAELTGQDEDQKILFVLVGGGPLESELREEALKRQLENVSIFPHLEFQRAMRMVSASDAIYIGYEPVDPNNHFASPHKLFEAMALGIPVLTSGYGYLARFVRKTGCGLCLDAIDGESIVAGVRRLFDKRLRARCSANGMRWFSSTYNWEAMTSRLESVYKAVAI
jgi:glycosyltransferase involved in cell wall biosynthesis